MKAVFLLLIIPLLQVSASAYAQRITLQEKNASIELVFKKIKKQSGYSFLYEDGVLNEAKKVNLSISNESLETTLDRLFAEQPLTFSIKGKTIVVQPKEKSVVDKIIDYFSAIDVRGKVLDEKGEPLQGATVKVKGSTQVVMSDKDGEFFLKGVQEDAVIVIAYLGYKPLELKASGSMGVIKMELGTSELDEVTVSTGYWSAKKALSTGSISKITAKEITNQPVTSPLLALQGRVAGLEITMPGNAIPGSAPIIRIRGNNSLLIAGKTGNIEGNIPLYVVDGVPIVSNPVLGELGSTLTSGGYDPLSTINLENIESIEVLKDADATSIYGSRGANGVILITTKNSKRDSKSTDLDVNVYRGLGHVSRTMEVLNTDQYLSMRKEALANDGVIASDTDVDLKYWDQNRYTDWQNTLIGGISDITDVQAVISSGGQNTSFLLGGGYHNETLIFPGDFGSSRATAHLNINHTSYDKKFKISFVTNYGIDHKNMFADEGLMQSALMLPPNAPKLYNEDGSLNWEIHEINGVMRSTWLNPLRSLYNKQKSVIQNLVSNAGFNFNLYPGLSIIANLGYTNMIGTEKQNYSINSSPPTGERTGAAQFNDNKRGTWIIEPKISYKKNFGGHNLDILAGTSWQRNISDVMAVNGSGYTSDALINSLAGAEKLRIFLEEFSEYKYMSIYGRIGYNWKEKYLLNLTGRTDGSSRFGSGKQFGNFGAVGVGWIFSEEKFIQKGISFMSFGKLRGSYGISGSDAAGDYRFYNLYSVLSESYDGIRGIVPDALYNSNFGWEATKKLELSLELGFLNNRIGMEMSWYRNHSSNQLIGYQLPLTTGFSSVFTNFDAIVENKGWEAIFRAEPVVSKHWKWDISFNISANRNKLLQFEGIENSPYVNIFKVGEPLSVQWLYTWTGVNPQTGLYEFIDENGDAKIDNFDRKLLSPTDRKYYGGINNSIQFKAFELAIQLQFSNQNSSRYMPDMPGKSGPGRNQPIAVLNRWFTTGDQTNIQRFSSFLNSEIGRRAYDSFLSALESNYNVENASFVRLKTLSFSYLLSPQLSSKIGLKQTKIFMYGQNLLTITKYSGLDPETGSGVPPLRMFTAGIQIKI